MRYTLAQVLTDIRNYAHPAHKRSLRAQAAAWYKRGYYKKTDGYWYSEHGGKEYRKYYTGE